MMPSASPGAPAAAAPTPGLNGQRRRISVVVGDAPRDLFEVFLGEAWASAYDLVAVESDCPLHDDDAEHLAGLLAYAWRTTGARQHLSEEPTRWPTGRLLVAAADITSRPRDRNRDAARATADMFRAVAGYAENGTPVRKDGTQLLGPLRQVVPLRFYVAQQPPPGL